MKRIFICLLAWGTWIQAAGALPEFPTETVNNYANLRAWFTDAAHTTARFEMERTMPSGRVLKSRGNFEYRRGQGMMWRTEHPVRNAMVITQKELSVYDARGRKLRTTNLEGASAARFTSAFAQEMTPDLLRQMERAFRVTCRTESERQLLILGLKARHSANDLRWMLLLVRQGILHQVHYESAKQGLTRVTFSLVKNSDSVPAGAFSVVP